MENKYTYFYLIKYSVKFPHSVSYAEITSKFLTETLLLLSLSKVWLAQYISFIHKGFVNASECLQKAFQGF